MMDFEQTKNRLDEYLMTGALEAIRDAILVLLAEVQRQRSEIDELKTALGEKS